MSIFQATQAPTYTKTTTETPTWMQDAIYSQIQSAQNIAARPYEAYQGQTVAGLSPYQQAAYQQVAENQGKWQPALSAAAQGMQEQSTGMWGTQTAAPYLNQAAFINQQQVAQPYLQQAGQNAYSTVQNYMNPYQQNVMDVIAKQGARNLTENLLPGVSDAFIKAGGFGGSRMGEFGSRALRDTQESILNQQAQLAQQGYTQSLGAAQTDAARQLQLGQTAGQLAGAQQSALAGLGGQFGNLANQDLARQQSALGALAQFGQMGQQMSAADVAALEAAGKAQQGQQQSELTDAYSRWQQQQMYPQQQLDWLSTQVRGMAPITPQTQVSQGSSSTGTSPLAQIASALSAGAGVYNAFNK